MFGYIRCDKDELKWKDYRQYSQYYCALCHTIGRKFGLLYRVTLSNDATFLLICMDALSEHTETVSKRCPTNPLKKTIVDVNSEIAEYVACLNFYLMQRKIIDSMQDTKSKIKRSILRHIHAFVVHNRAYLNWSRQEENLVKKLDRLFDELYETENKASGFDILTNIFGRITASFTDGLADYIEDSDAVLHLSVLFFNIGKWIYLADALDDYAKDVQNGEFNLLQTLHVMENEELELQYIRMSYRILLLLHKKMLPSYQKIGWKHSQAIIENILFSGTLKTMNGIISSRFDEIKKCKADI